MQIDDPITASLALPAGRGDGPGGRRSMIKR
jgi:hypothetical protein